MNPVLNCVVSETCGSHWFPPAERLLWVASDCDSNHTPTKALSWFFVAGLTAHPPEQAKGSRRQARAGERECEVVHDVLQWRARCSPMRGALRRLRAALRVMLGLEPLLLSTRCMQLLSCA